MPMELHHLKTVNEYHKVRGLARPVHPLIGIVDYSQVKVSENDHLKLDV